MTGKANATTEQGAGEQKHSPLPWNACHEGNCVCGEIWSRSADVPVAVTSWTFDRFDMVPNLAHVQANAKYIVTAVNGYPDALARAERAEAEARLFRNILEDTLYVLRLDDLNDAKRQVGNLQIAIINALATSLPVAAADAESDE